MRPRPWFWPLYGLILLMAAWAGTEFVSSYFVPSFPARDLRPVSAEAVRSNLQRAFAETPDLIPTYNDWGMRDRPRSLNSCRRVLATLTAQAATIHDGRKSCAPAAARGHRRNS